MKIRAAEKSQGASVFLEVLLAMGIVGVAFTSLYFGIGQCFVAEQGIQEDMRATQILQEKTETIRLYTWDQVTNSGFLPSTFTNYYYGAVSNNQGTVYSGTVTVTNAGMTEAYNNDLMMITITLNWATGRTARQRQVNTLVSRYGLHNYIYN